MIEEVDIMLCFIENFKHYIVAIGIILLILGAWYLINNRDAKEAPERADLVFNIESAKNREINYE